MGHLILSETDPHGILDDKPYTVVFLDRDRDQLGSVYKRKSSYKICLWLDLGGLQLANCLSLRTGLPCNIESISYLDQNENENEIGFQSFPSFGIVSATFDKILTKSIKVVISTTISLETSLFENEFGRSYCIQISEVKVRLDSYRNSGYYLSKPLVAKNVKGAKIRVKFDTSDEFVLERYLKVEEKSQNRLSKYRTIPLLENYNIVNTFAL